jgi:microcystin-dependent protein
LCNGSTFNITTYPELYQVLGTNILPDLRNQFIRGAFSSSDVG